ncbi:MAG: hypothetical protein J6T48_11515 [Bacteroidales bacterium]|nr:hypothetical protein [Bacteroidales bacterium]MBO7572766.1 hypothetical protein [Bacteroidales bacterium]
MKRSLILVLLAALSLVFVAGCHKDPLDMGKVGFLRLELRKGYKTMNKGSVESFYAKVTVVYSDEDEIVYNCLFSDPGNTGIYSNDINEGDRLYVRKNVEFRLIIEADIDGYHVIGESGTMMFDDDVDLSSIEIVLRAGQTRIAIYAPKDDEIFGNYVVAYGEILENVSQMPIREAGIMCVPKSVYDTYDTPEAFTFENENNSSSWFTEFYFSEQDEPDVIEDMPSISKFSVVIRGLEPNTRYCMRAFTFSEGDTAINYCYSRVIEFSTNNNVAHDISVITNDAGNVTMESVDVAGRVVVLDGIPADSVENMGFIFDTYENYIANSSSLDYYRNNMFTYPASEIRTQDDIIAFSATVSGLQEGASYVFRAYAVFREQPYYGSVKMFAVLQNPENIRLQADETTSVLTASYVDLQGSILNDAGYEFSEIGFKYIFSDAGSAVASAEDLTGTAAGSVMSGRFSARVNLPIVNKIMYYAPYAITTTGYIVYGDLSSAVSIEPANVPSISMDPQQSVSDITPHSMVVTCNVDANGRSDCECGIVFVTDTADHASYDTVRKVAYSSGTEEFTLNGLRKGTNYTYWAYVRVVDEFITTDQYSVTTSQEGDRGPGGGIIFYADDNNGFALEYIMPSTLGGDDMEIGDSAVWGSTAGIALNTDAPSSITVSGMTNTEAIVSYHTGIGFTDEYAALKCYQSTQGGKNDWYLPTSVEMQALVDYVGEELYSTFGGFWTSDENSATNAVAFISSQTTYSSQSALKSTLYNYIMVRRF